MILDTFCGLGMNHNYTQVLRSRHEPWLYTSYVFCGLDMNKDYMQVLRHRYEHIDYKQVLYHDYT